MQIWVRAVFIWRWGLNFSEENYSLKFEGLFTTSIYDGSTLIVSVCPAWGVENVCRLYWGIFPLDGKSRKKATSKDGRSDAASILIDSESWNAGLCDLDLRSWDGKSRRKAASSNFTFSESWRVGQGWLWDWEGLALTQLGWQGWLWDWAFGLGWDGKSRKKANSEGVYSGTVFSGTENLCFN